MQHARHVVHPRFCALDILLINSLVEIRSFREISTDETIRDLIAAAFMRTVWMAIEYVCTLSDPVQCLFHALEVCKFRSVIYSDAFEKLEKITSINLFEPVQGADNLFRRWCLHNLDNFFSSDTLGQNQEAFSIRRHTFDRIHFPMTKFFAIGYNFRAKINRCDFCSALGLLNALALFPAVPPAVWQILQF